MSKISPKTKLSQAGSDQSICPSRLAAEGGGTIGAALSQLRNIQKNAVNDANGRRHREARTSRHSSNRKTIDRLGVDETMKLGVVTEAQRQAENSDAVKRTSGVEDETRAEVKSPKEPSSPPVPVLPEPDLRLVRLYSHWTKGIFWRVLILFCTVACLLQSWFPTSLFDTMPWFVFSVVPTPRVLFGSYDNIIASYLRWHEVLCLLGYCVDKARDPDALVEGPYRLVPHQKGWLTILRCALAPFCYPGYVMDVTGDWRSFASVQVDYKMIDLLRKKHPHVRPREHTVQLFMATLMLTYPPDKYDACLTASRHMYQLLECEYRTNLLLGIGRGPEHR